MLKRLGSYPRQNGVAQALREVGRIEPTLFTLDWLDDPALRRQATAELNKGESRARCLIPGFDGADFSLAWRDALWARFFTAAPQRQRQSVERYSIVKRA